MTSGVLKPVVLGDTHLELSLEESSLSEEEESRSDSVIPANRSNLLALGAAAAGLAPSLLFRKESDDIRLSDIFRLPPLPSRNKDNLFIDSPQ